METGSAAKSENPHGQHSSVLVYQIARGPFAPSMSPYPIKLETYLRLAKIPYKNDFSSKFSSKGKTPWITYNGEPVADSQFCIEFLNKKLGVDLNKNLTKEQKAVAKALQVMVDEHLHWTVVYFRWVDSNAQTSIKIAFPSFFVRWYILRHVKQNLHSQGIGRHTAEEIKHILLTDLQALADYLGDKPYIMGDVPCETDCSIFGMLCQIAWHGDGFLKNLVQDHFPALHQYCLRMKDTAWPDWDECITHGGTKQPTR